MKGYIASSVFLPTVWGAAFNSTARPPFLFPCSDRKKRKGRKNPATLEDDCQGDVFDGGRFLENTRRRT